MEIKINNGIIKGLYEKGVYAFKGIPFAKPPVGNLRFKPPVPCEDWVGALDCTCYGLRPCQNPPPWCEDRAIAVYGEDCLNLNVWTPGTGGKKRPVVFNIFGGGHMEGSNSEIGSEGYNLAHGRDIVVVAPNYRVGALGYLYLGHLLGEEYAASGNSGLLDQVLALKWVKDNIGFFGGDPNRVTIIGQSAGGKSVANLMVTPEASGLFHGAVAMSGALQSITDIQTDKALTGNFLSAMGLQEKDASKLLSCPVRDILEAQEVANKIYFKAESYGPTADGIVVPLDIKAYILQGKLPKIPVLMGHTLEELNFPPEAGAEDIGLEALADKFRWKFGDNGAYIMELYKKARLTKSYPEAYGSIATEYTYVQAYMQTAELFINQGLPVWLYRWDFRGGHIAHHSSDNEALFGRSNPLKLQREPGATRFLDHAFQDALLSFVEEGHPRGPDLPPWNPCARGELSRLLFDVPPGQEKLEKFSYDRNFPLQVFRLSG
ncbi:MAG: carboxylesterase family protein [Treponema sp.]|nr:carboxylesterase family protein [Treponema sp.]